MHLTLVPNISKIKNSFCWEGKKIDHLTFTSHERQIFTPNNQGEDWFTVHYRVHVSMSLIPILENAVMRNIFFSSVITQNIQHISHIHIADLNHK